MPRMKRGITTESLRKSFYHWPAVLPAGFPVPAVAGVPAVAAVARLRASASSSSSLFCSALLSTALPRGGGKSFTAGKNDGRRAGVRGGPAENTHARRVVTHNV